MKIGSMAFMLICFSAGGFAQEQSEVRVNEKLLTQIDLRQLGRETSKPQKAEKAIKEGKFTFRKYTVKKNDTLSQIIEQHNIRSEPVSIELVKSINKNLINSKKIMPGQEIVIPVATSQPEGSNPFVLNVATFEKLKLIENASKFNAMKLTNVTTAVVKDYNAFLTSQDNKGFFPEASASLSSDQRIMLALNAWSVTNYVGSSELIEDVQKGMVLVQKVYEKAPQEWSVKEKEYVEQFAQRTTYVAKAAYSTSYDAPQIEANVETWSGEDVKFNVDICYHTAFAYDNYKFITEDDVEPDWACGITRFDMPSSPAKHYFTINTEYVIWAWDGEKRISDYQVVRIEPNQEIQTKFFKKLLLKKEAFE